MHSKSEIMINDETDKIIEEFFDLLKNRYQNKLESMRRSPFVWDSVQLLYYKSQKISPNRGGLYISSSDWIKNGWSNNKSYQ